MAKFFDFFTIFSLSKIYAHKKLGNFSSLIHTSLFRSSFMNTTNTEKPDASGKEPPKMPGALPIFGHMLSFGKNPFQYMMTLRNTLGEIGEFRMFHQKMVLQLSNAFQNDNTVIDCN